HSRRFPPGTVHPRRQASGAGSVAPPGAGAPGHRRRRQGHRPGREHRRREGTRVGRMTAWRLAALIAAGAACQERAQEVRSEAELKQTVDQMMPAVERATGLKFRRHPLVLRRSRTQVRDYVIHKFDSDLPPAELAGAQAAYRLFGLIPEQKLESLPDFWQLRRALSQQQEQMRIFAQAPQWLRESLLFPYLGGAEFVRWFEREHPGEQPYGKRMPVSTEQILHPSR